MHNQCAFALFKHAQSSRKLPGACNQQSWERGKRLLNGKGSPGVNDAVDENDSGALGLPSPVVIVGFKHGCLSETGIDRKCKHALRLVAVDVVVVRVRGEDAV